jgi:hypothetical protein
MTPAFYGKTLRRSIETGPFDELKAELLCPTFPVREDCRAALLRIVFGPPIDVGSAIFQHTANDDRRLMRGGNDGFRCAQAGAHPSRIGPRDTDKVHGGADIDAGRTPDELRAEEVSHAPLKTAWWP